MALILMKENRKSKEVARESVYTDFQATSFVTSQADFYYRV